MDGVVVLAGCILSFLCGAYVRNPFAVICIDKKEKKESTENDTDSQWENFWSYDGEKQ